MVDLSTFYRISKALTRAATRLLLIGDPAQLPPIGAGLVFHRLVQESYGPQIELKQVWRQSEDTGIPAVARAVRQGVVPKLAEQLLPEGVCFIESEEPLRDCLRLRTEMLSAGGEVTVYRKSARAINSALQPGRAFSSGDPVMFTINDTEVGLSNGSLGRISEVSADAVHVKRDDGREIPIASWRMLYLHLAYAVTVHKLQGSQTEQAIVLVEPSRLLDRPLLYTAITRAPIGSYGSRGTASPFAPRGS
jgi:exodeoxyribonuclease V alpha subunit